MKNNENMSNGDLNKLMDQFIALRKTGQDLELSRSKWAAALYAHPTIEGSEPKLRSWFDLYIELEDSDPAVDAWVAYAKAGTAVRDTKTLTELLTFQGAPQIAKLARIDKSRHARVIELSRRDRLTIGTILTRSNDGASDTLREPTKTLSQAHRDAERLAKHIALYVDDVPKEIADIVNVYAPGVRKPRRRERTS